MTLDGFIEFSRRTHRTAPVVEKHGFNFSVGAGNQDSSSLSAFRLHISATCASPRFTWQESSRSF